MVWISIVDGISVCALLTQSIFAAECPTFEFDPADPPDKTRDKPLRGIHQREIYESRIELIGSVNN